MLRLWCFSRSGVNSDLNRASQSRVDVFQQLRILPWEGFRQRTGVRLRSGVPIAEECLANLPAHRPIVVPFPPWVRGAHCRIMDRVPCQNDLAGNEGPQGESGDPRCLRLGAGS